MDRYPFPPRQTEKIEVLRKTAVEAKLYDSFASTFQQITIKIIITKICAGFDLMDIRLTHGSITKWSAPSAIASKPGSPA